MSEKDILERMKVKASGLSEDKKVPPQDSEPPEFHRCRYRKCGQDELRLESRSSSESKLFGITSHGDIGCSPTEVEHYHLHGIYCQACGHRICGASFSDNVCDDEVLFEWAKSQGEALTALTFVCPKCDSFILERTEVGIDFFNHVMAVCESDSPGGAPLIALWPIRYSRGGRSYRYRCSKGHELAKDDGTPVETAEELVEWLKACSAANNR
jgi:hypothetical protein